MISSSLIGGTVDVDHKTLLLYDQAIIGKGFASTIHSNSILSSSRILISCFGEMNVGGADENTKFNF